MGRGGGEIAGLTERVVIPYVPREIFKPFHSTLKRFAVIVAHRRAGKTVACVNRLIKSAITCPRREARVAYVAPHFNQAKDVAWNYVRRYALAIPGAEANEAELRVDLPNGARVRLYGADNYDRLRGGYLDDVVLDEYADIDPRAWSEVIRPALSDRGGRAVFIGTPKGRNAFYELCHGTPDGSWIGAERHDDWFFSVLRASETGVLSAEELASARESMTEDQYAQEYECSFEAAVIGAFFGKEMDRAVKDGRIGVVPWEPNLPVVTAWDLGRADSTAIWFAQTRGREVRLIDYYEASGAGLDHYAKVLREKPYAYATHALLPHDAAVHELSNNTSRLATLRSLGINGRVLPRHSLHDGINAARLLIARCWFDRLKCNRGIEALRLYRREFDDKRKAFNETPVHDWTSHPADAFRYLAAGLREEVTQAPQRIADANYDPYRSPVEQRARQTHADDYSPI